eukprot:TRINITY_DN45329_c0_g1_i1.p1 TRINITY_DN45329_c0_g1~~TRINITY_DN45329_c0_g1_i1.p1  ORF type:complete len:128 (-),score=18.34 TRINITY_DN45329_c0_g1_i1:126-509(-)
MVELHEQPASRHFKTNHENHCHQLFVVGNDGFLVVVSLQTTFEIRGYSRAGHSGGMSVQTSGLQTSATRPDVEESATDALLVDGLSRLCVRLLTLHFFQARIEEHVAHAEHVEHVEHQTAALVKADI